MIEPFFMRAKRRQRGRRHPRAVLATLGRPAPRLVWNVSASAPIGLYRVLPGKPVRGDLVLVQAPGSLRQLAADRGYLPSNVPLVKRIVAAGDDVVCAAGDAISINGRVVAERLARRPAWPPAAELERLPSPRWRRGLPTHGRYRGLL